MSFDPMAADKRFFLAYKMDTHIPEPTVIFASPENYPPGLLRVEIQPENVASASLEPPYIYVTPLPGLRQGQSVNITVTAAPGGS